jgi:hypothetical protein
MKSFAAATRELQRRLGARVVATDEKSRFAASFDSSKISFLPAAVIKPRRVEQVGAALAGFSAALASDYDATRSHMASWKDRPST